MLAVFGLLMLQSTDFWTISIRRHIHYFPPTHALLPKRLQKFTFEEHVEQKVRGKLQECRLTLASEDTSLLHRAGWNAG